MPTPIFIPADKLLSACSRFTSFGAHRSEDPMLHNVLVERGEGRVILGMSNVERFIVYCWMPVPLPLTEMQRKLMRPKWQLDAVRFLIPLADLREANRKAGGLIALNPGEIHTGTVSLARFTAPDAAEYPAVFPPLPSITEGWSSQAVRAGRVDVMALAAEDDDLTVATRLPSVSANFCPLFYTQEWPKHEIATCPQCLAAWQALEDEFADAKSMGPERVLVGTALPEQTPTA
jgi:hypothetical protein